MENNELKPNHETLGIFTLFNVALMTFIVLIPLVLKTFNIVQRLDK
jgi:hypothetical protein